MYVNTRKHDRGKLDPRAVVMRFLSVDDRSKGFRLWTGKTIVIGRKVRPKLNVNLKYEDPITKIDLCHDSVDNREQTTILPKDDSISQTLPTLRRSKRIAEKKISTEFANVSNSNNDPKSYKEATNRADSKEWIKC